MVAAKANITVEQGTDFSTTLTVEDENGNATNLTGYTGKKLRLESILHQTQLQILQYRLAVLELLVN